VRRGATCRRSEDGRQRAERRNGVGQQLKLWPAADEGAPRRNIGGEVVAFQRFLVRAAEGRLWQPNQLRARHPADK